MGNGEPQTFVSSQVVLLGDTRWRVEWTDGVLIMETLTENDPDNMSVVRTAARLLLDRDGLAALEAAVAEAREKRVRPALRIAQQGGA